MLRSRSTRRARALPTRGPRLLAAAFGPWLAACSDSMTRILPPPSPFQKVTLNDAPGEPVSLSVLPDGRVLHATRPGEVWLHDPLTGDNSLSATLPVYAHDEEGILGIQASPDFEQTGWVYVYYSPPLSTPLDDPSTMAENEGDAPLTATPASWAPFAGLTRLSRFRLVGAQLDLSTEQVVLEIPTDRGACCHMGGDIDFDAAGLLYLSTGDDTNPFFSDGYAPLDERELRYPALDAQRSAANTNDLRGKLLRFRVNDEGQIEIPSGNLFSPGDDQTRPEIFLMGLRNPYRFAVNRLSGDVYLADYAPDAPVADAERGPVALGRWLSLREAGNQGWPYCRGSELPYRDFDFETRTAGPAFDCSAPVNDSPHNTGRRELPAVAEPKGFSYSYAPSSRLPDLGSGGIGPMAGPAYEYRGELASEVKWPQALSGRPLFYEWVRDFVGALELDASGEVSALERLPFPVDNPIDLEFGPDGALYVLEYGNGYFTANPEAQLSRVEYRAPDQGNP